MAVDGPVMVSPAVDLNESSSIPVPDRVMPDADCYVITSVGPFGCPPRPLIKSMERGRWWLCIGFINFVR